MVSVSGLKKLSLVIGLSVLSACSMLNDMLDDKPAPVKLTEAQMQETMFKRHSEHFVTIKNGTSILQAIQIFRNAGVPVMVSNNMDVSSLRYTGPDLEGVNAMDAIQLITGLTVLDYTLHPRSGLITIVPAYYYRYNMPVPLEQHDWDVLLEATDKASQAYYTDKNGVSRNTYIATVLEDKLTNTIRVAAPMHTRLKIAAIINSYGTQLVNPSSAGIVSGVDAIRLPSRVKAKTFQADEVIPGENVEVGKIAPPVRFD